MTETEQALLQSLLDLEAAIASMPTADPKPDLMTHFNRIDQLAGLLPSNTDPSLRHYLAKRSYLKARLFLEGRDDENQVGSCGHV